MDKNLGIISDHTNDGQPKKFLPSSYRDGKASNDFTWTLQEFRRNLTGDEKRNAEITGLILFLAECGLQAYILLPALYQWSLTTESKDFQSPVMAFIFAIGAATLPATGYLELLRRANMKGFVLAARLIAQLSETYVHESGTRQPLPDDMKRRAE